MSKSSLFLVVAALVTLVGTDGQAEDWKVGEKWVYKHEGPRPFGDPTAKVEGDRRMAVAAIQGEGDQKRYLLKAHWGTNDPNPSTSYIDAKNLIHKIDVQDMAVLLFAPPLPAVWKLKAGEQKTIKTQMGAAGFVIPMECQAKRLPNETLTVPAGTFEKCQHVQILSTLDNPMGEPIKTKTDYWYHPKVRGAVKEVTVTNLGTPNSTTATSTLKSHTKKD